MFERYHDILEEAEITSDWLEKRFGIQLPNISFKLSELSKLDFDTLMKLARAIGVVYKRPRKPTLQDKNGLKRTIISKLA